MDNSRDIMIARMASTMQLLARSKGSDELLVYSLNQVLAGLRPSQIEVVRRCAVPRWFDASVLAVLRESTERNEHILEQLRGYSFVRDLGDGRLAYHPQVRAALLADWRENRPGDLIALHQRLATYFSRRTTPLGVVRTPQPASEALHAVPYSPFRDLCRREALYHQLNADPQRGLAELRREFEALAEVHRLAEAEALLQVAGEAPLDAYGQAWLRYLHARVYQAALRLDDALAWLCDLVDDVELDAEIDAFARRSLAEVYAELGQWALATSLYRESLAYFEQHGDRSAAAETLLLLGEAYEGLGDQTGSWSVALAATTTPLRLIGLVWEWLLALPFWLIRLVVPRGRWFLPLPRYCARYQNWLLIRLYNTARGYYLRARDLFEALGDQHGLLSAEQRLADLLRLYGYADEARARIEALMTRPAARDAYRMARLERSLAACLLVQGDLAVAQQLIDRALRLFRELADVRREASTLALQGLAETMTGNAAGALASYRDSLARFRALNYVAAREKILHNLRLWRREQPPDGPVARQITRLIADEPEKRYVGRFLSRYLPLLQIASILALPLALLALANAVPTTVVEGLAGGPLSLKTFYDPLRALGVLAILAPLYLASYALMALSVIFFLPITRIETEQPDMIETSPHGIARYNSLGELREAMEWNEIVRWIALDRCIWGRPLALYSRMFLEHTAGDELRIEGIIGWYSDVCADLEQRLAEARRPVPRINLGYDLLASPSGAAALLGALLLLLCTSAANGWLPLLAWIGPQAYTVLSLIAFSGILMMIPTAYWLVNRPLKLQRTLDMTDSWPALVGLMGAWPVLLYLTSGGAAFTVPIINISTFLWGAYALVEALVALAPARLRRLRVPIVLIAMLAALAFVAPRAEAIVLQSFSSISTENASDMTDMTTAGLAPSEAVSDAQQGYAAAAQAIESGGDRYSNLMSQGKSAFVAGDYLLAIQSYTAAIQAAPPGSPRQALALHNRARSYQRAGDEGAARRDEAAAHAICLTPDLARDRICRDLLAARQP